MSPSATTANGRQTQAKRFVRAYQPFDEEAVMHICRTTAHESALQEPANSLVPIIFALPYVYLYPEYCFVVDSGDCAFSHRTAQFPNGAGTALGYINGVPDSALYLQRIKEEYFTYLTSLDATRWQRPLPEEGATSKVNGAPVSPAYGGNEIEEVGKTGDSVKVYNALMKRLWNPDESILHSAWPELLRAYPGHLHIDILPELQREGWGKRLMRRFIARCRSDGVKGLHLMKGGDNIGTTVFYEKVGFQRWQCNMDGNSEGIIGRKPGGAVCMVIKVEAEDVKVAYADVDSESDW